MPISIHHIARGKLPTLSSPFLPPKLLPLTIVDCSRLQNLASFSVFFFSIFRGIEYCGWAQTGPMHSFTAIKQELISRSFYRVNIETIRSPVVIAADA